MLCFFLRVAQKISLISFCTRPGPFGLLISDCGHWTAARQGGEAARLAARARGTEGLKDRGTRNGGTAMLRRFVDGARGDDARTRMAESGQVSQARQVRQNVASFTSCSGSQHCCRRQVSLLMPVVSCRVLCAIDTFYAVFRLILLPKAREGEREPEAKLQGDQGTSWGDQVVVFSSAQDFCGDRMGPRDGQATPGSGCG